MRIFGLILPTATFAIGLAIGTSYTIVNPFVQSGSGDYLNLPAAQSNFASYATSTAYFPGGLFISTRPDDAITMHSEAGSGSFDLSCKIKEKIMSGRLSSPWLKDVGGQRFDIFSKGEPVRPLSGTIYENGSLQLDDADVRALITALIDASFPGAIGISYRDPNGKVRLLVSINTIGIQNVRAWERLVSPSGGWRREILQPPAEPFSSFLRLCIGKQAIHSVPD